MDIIFLTMVNLQGIKDYGIYQDLMRKFRDEGHRITIVFPRERRYKEPTSLNVVDGVNLLGVRTLNLLNASIIEKGIGQVLLERQYSRAIKRFCPNSEFDMVLYSTPPITFSRVIRFILERNPTTKSYLLLKDIFPQNAVDLGIMSEYGVKGLLYRFFRRKEEDLYHLSDYIGCMSPANIQYLLKHNPGIDPEKVEVAPNSIELKPRAPVDRVGVRKKYNLPINKPIFIYGGNLGKPQGIDFLLECLMVIKNREDCHFIVIGSGTESPKIKKWFYDVNPQAITVMDGIPKNEYDELVRACDVGLVFLDHRFTIPNYPSRLLSYLENKMPIIAATDLHTDIGKIAEENGYGFWCESNDVSSFILCVNRMLDSDIETMGQKGYEFLKKNYLVEHTYAQIMKHFQ